MKTRLLIFAIIPVLFVLIGCNSNKTKNTEKEIQVTWGGPKNISMLPIIAEKKGFFKEEGLNIETKYLQTGKIAMDALLSKDLDFAVMVETNVAFIEYQKGADIEVICSIEEKYDDAIVARKDKGINEPKDLEGKTVGILIGTTSHVFADRFVNYYNLDASKINFINLAPPAIQAGLLTGQIDAGSVWQPFRYNVEKQLGEDVIQFNAKDIYKAYGIISIRNQFGEEHPETVKKFLAALIKAENYVKTNQAKSIKILAKELAMQEEVLSAIWSEYILNVKLDAELLTLIKEEGEWIHSSQKGFENKQVPSYENVLNPTFLSELKKENAEELSK
ncbi:MAG: NrtA/SsuA/CpmA family ABC transporter substrate-binding protein [Bacteroidales bacterium]|nr:NrtA/SsuA/CpmA family ABC transporter substrate-binding protein [Bacteroidales bacterium]